MWHLNSSSIDCLARTLFHHSIECALVVTLRFLAPCHLFCSCCFSRPVFLCLCPKTDGAELFVQSAEFYSNFACRVCTLISIVCLVSHFFGAIACSYDELRRRFSFSFFSLWVWSVLFFSNQFIFLYLGKYYDFTLTIAPKWLTIFMREVYRIVLSLTVSFSMVR